MAQPSLDKPKKPKPQLFRHACETAKHHLNPSSATAKDSTFGGSKTATPPKSELSHSKKQYIRRVQNGTFGTP